MKNKNKDKKSKSNNVSLIVTSIFFVILLVVFIVLFSLSGVYIPNIVSGNGSVDISYIIMFSLGIVLMVFWIIDFAFMIWYIYLISVAEKQYLNSFGSQPDKPVTYNSSDALYDDDLYYDNLECDDNSVLISDDNQTNINKNIKNINDENKQDNLKNNTSFENNNKNSDDYKCKFYLRADQKIPKGYKFNKETGKIEKENEK